MFETSEERESLSSHSTIPLGSSDIQRFEVDDVTTSRASFIDSWKDETPLSFNDVVAEERECMDRQRGARVIDGMPSDKKFSVAFSGGGMRAAAFESGVLWRLAEADMLKDVEYWAAVSGGGYITSSFASHCAAAPEPRKGEVRKWYLERIAETLCRMQRNAGNFVRDIGLGAGTPEDGSGLLPRILDLPMLFAMIGVTVCINPFYFMVCLVIPTAVIIEIFFGAAMRATFCSLAIDPYRKREGDLDDKQTIRFTDMVETMDKYSPLAVVVGAAGVFLLLGTIVSILSHLVPCLQQPKQRQPGEEAPADRYGDEVRAWRPFYIAYATKSLFFRTAIYLSAFLVIIGTSVMGEMIKYEGWNTTKELRMFQWKACAFYIERGRLNLNTQERMKGVHCADQYMGDFWYKNSSFDLSLNAEQREGLDLYIQEPNDCLQGLEKWWGEDFPEPASTALVGPATKVLTVCVGVAVLLTPLLGTGPLLKILLIGGPFLLFFITVTCVRFAVFGPLTGNKLGKVPIYGKLPFCRPIWRQFCSYVFMAWFIIIPIYPELRKLLHRYYKRCLTMNFFKDGQDIQFHWLAKAIYCPYVVLTGSSSDTWRAGDNSNVFEIFFTALHCGGKELGFVRQPTYRSLGKCTALTGAGAVDALVLTMTDLLAARFWLEVFSFSWGDFITFTRTQLRCTGGLVHKAGLKGGEWMFLMIHRIIAGLPFFVLICLVNVAWWCETNAMGGCFNLKLSWAIYVLLGWLLHALSFYSFLPWTELLTMLPVLRHFDQATSKSVPGEVPPPMVYVTDGGVQDCTSLCQLLLRRCERILLVLAAADPNDELKVLQAAIEVAHRKKLAAFYTAEDPRVSLDDALAAFGENLAAPYLHIGVLYPRQTPASAKETGHIFIVKNRLPPQQKGMVTTLPLTREEIVDGAQPVPVEPAMDADELGSWPCCNCCHLNGWNCGAKFPHGSAFPGYLWLSPMWFSSLARLGHALSEDVLDQLRSDKLQAAWEDII